MPFLLLVTLLAGPVRADELAITLDDPNLALTPLLMPDARNAAILRALEKAGLKTILFVCGSKVDTPRGKTLLRTWSRAGHELGNHTYSHTLFNRESMTVAAFSVDTVKNEPLIEGLPGFVKRFRYPFLKEGDTRDKRNGMRSWLVTHGYRSGAVSVDASDWAIDDRLRARLTREPKADVTPYRDYYVKHILDRATYYRTLARDVVGRPVKHVLLLHHNLLNALFLGDLIVALKADGWTLVNPETAYSDPIYGEDVDLVPAGESVVWQVAKKKGRTVRYPAEDAAYEAPAMDKLGL